MPRETTAIPTTGAEASLGAAAFLAVLAYPDELAKRDAVVAAARAAWLRAHAPAGATRFRRVRADPIDSVLNALSRRICKQRLPAVAVFLFQAAGHPAAAGLRWIARQHSPARLAGRAPHEVDDVERDGRKRILRPTRAVLHLALTLQGVVAASGGRLNVVKLILGPEWLPEAVTRAEEHRSTIARMPAPLRVPDSETIQLLAR